MRNRFASLLTGALLAFLPLTLPLFAQEAPVSPEGTQVATDATPAAATNAEELRKASQNPVASLISVPIQENFNFGIGPADRTQNALNIQPVNISAELYGNAVHPPGASPWTLRLSFVLLFPKLTKDQEKMLLEQKLKQMDQAPPQKN